MRDTFLLELCFSIQKRLRELYKEMDGEYYSGEDAWAYLSKITGTDLKRFFEDLKE